MNTDELIEQRLRDVGERWMSAHDEPARVDLGGLAESGRGPGRRRLVLAAVSGVAVAAAVAAGVLFAVHRSPSPSTAPAVGTNASGEPPPHAVASRTTDQSALQGVTWHLDSIDEQRGNSGSGSGASSYAAATLRFVGNAIVIGDGCSSTTAHSELGAGTLDIAQYVDGGLTEPACATVDQALMAVLVDRSTWHIDGNQLTITKGDTSLVYNRGAGSRATPLPSSTPTR